jgi:hypothetical protein
MFVQLPHCLPIARTTPLPAADTGAGVGLPSKASEAAAAAAAAASAAAAAACGDESGFPSLAGAAEGWIGKLRVHQSGRMTMRIGNVDFDVRSQDGVKRVWMALMFVVFWGC